MCGVVGVVGEDAGSAVYEALVALQHRGQDAAGLCVYDRRLYLKKGAGLVSEVFRDAQFPNGVLAVGHVRYPTIGLGASRDAQPFTVPAPFGIALAHNGNIVNYAELRKELWHRHKHILNSDCDAELLLAVFAEELAARCHGKALSFNTLCDAVSAIFCRVSGSYSAVALIAGHGLVAFRDPYGIKPLSLGRSGKRFAFVSESVALDVLGLDEVGDVAPGEVVYVDVAGRVRRRRLRQERRALCIFEFVYFARPDSV
ncbi:MAG: amidophosphoribosyltransferase, partial [Planctomycetota bacterium]